MKKALTGLFAMMFVSVCMIASVFADPKGDKVVQDMVKAWKGISDYQCMFSFHEDKGKGMEGGSYKYSFKKPLLIRLEGVEGENKGTTVAYRPDQDANTVHVKKGFLPLKLKKTDKRLESFFKSHWGFDIQDIQAYIKSSGASVVVKGNGDVKGRKTITLELAGKKPVDGVTKEVVQVDNATKMPLQIERYKGSTLNSKRLYWDLKVNTKFSADDIKI